jgi:hypothetical protein
VLACVALGAAAQPVVVPPAAPRCESVVVVRCEPTPEAATSSRPEARRMEERRRSPLDGVELERIVIEADPIRPSLESILSRPFAARPTQGTHTFSTGEGTQCTCMNRCPPFPFPCCDCSSPMSRYSAMPGASPLR